MFRFFTVFMLLLFSNIAFAADKTLPRDITRLEDTFFNQQFKDESQPDRLDRLEYRAFGALQQGSDEERVKKLKSAALNYRSKRVQDLEQEFYPYYNQPTITTTSGWKGVFGNLNNYFNGGVPTGMSPQIYYPPNVLPQHYHPNSYYRSSNRFYNNRPRSIFNNGYSRYVKNNRGEWAYDNINTGSSTGITILD